MITKEKKEETIKDLISNIKESKNVIFLNFNKADVAKTNQLRKELKNKEAYYKVAKKTLIRKAFDAFDFKGDLLKELKGETALIFLKGEGFIDIVKSILTKVKEGKFKIFGGLFEKEFQNAEFIVSLSKLPSKQILYANLVYALNSPLRRMVGVFNGSITNFVRVLDQASHSDGIELKSKKS